MPGCRRDGGVLVGLCCVALGLALPAVRAAEAPVVPALPEARGLAVGLFDDHSGRRIGRLEVERVGLEFRKHGFLRVAWRPGARWEGVTLDLRPAGDLAASGPQILRTLRAVSHGSTCDMRRVRVTLPDDRVLEAAAARLGADGGLRLSGASAPGDRTAARDGVLWLSGPRAGRWEPATAAAGPPAASPAQS